MNATFNEKVEQLSAAKVLEAAQMRLPELLGIDDPTAAAARVCELAGLSSADLATLTAEVQRAATDSRAEIANLLRGVLIDLAESEPKSGETERALDAVGRKEIAIGPEVYQFGSFLILAYIAYKGAGRKSTEVKTTLEKGKDGREKVTISKKVVYLDPLSALVKLIERVLK